MLRVLMVAITNGAAQDCRSSSNIGLFPGGCFGPSNPGVKTNGSFSSATRLRSFATASNVARALAAVPPEKVPRMSRTALHARGRSAKGALCHVLHVECAKLERQRIEAAGEHDARA